MVDFFDRIMGWGSKHNWREQENWNEPKQKLNKISITVDYFYDSGFVVSFRGLKQTV